MNLRKDVVRRAANIQENSCSSCVDSLLEALRPPLLRDMQDTGHCILSPLKKIVVGLYQANCYILGCNKTMQGIVIDPGDEVFRIVKEISRTGLRIGHILITHGHPDHTGGCKELRDII